MIAPLSGLAQRAARSDAHRLVIYEGSVRSGKTVASLLGFLRFARAGPAGNLLMAGKTERTLKRNLIDPLTEMLGPARCRHLAGSGELHLVGRRVYLAGANDERAQEKIRGLTLAGAYCDELSTFPESFFAMLLSRLSLEGARLFATTNPDAPTHWLKAGYLDRAALHASAAGELEAPDGETPLDLARFSFRLSDNPYLSEGYVRAISAEYSGLWRRRFILGEWVAAEGAIYDMLDLTPGARHVCRELPAIEDYWLSIDYGTTNPFSALLIGLGVDARLYVVREWRWAARTKHRQLTDAEYAARLTAWVEGGCEGAEPATPDAPLPIRGIVIDPSAASFRAQLQRAGWGWATRAENEVLDGIRSTASLLAAGRLRIHESCTELLRELAGYVWDARAAERGEDAPLKQDDHGPDALRYFVASESRLWRGWLAQAPPEAE